MASRCREKRRARDAIPAMAPRAIIAATLTPTPPLPPAAIDAPRRMAGSWIGRGLLFVAVVLLLEHARPLLLPVTLAIVFTFVLSAPVRALRRAGVHEYAGRGDRHRGRAGRHRRGRRGDRGAGRRLVVARAVDRAGPFRGRAALARGAVPLFHTRRAGALAGGGGGRSIRSVPSWPSRAGPSPAWQSARRIAFTVSAVGDRHPALLPAGLRALAGGAHRRRDPAAGARARCVLSGFRQAQRDIGLFISTMSIINVALGVATGLALWLIGLPNPVLWGTTTAVLTFVPYLGPLLVTAAAAARRQRRLRHRPRDAGAAGGLPRSCTASRPTSSARSSWGTGCRLSPVFVFLSVLVWGWLWGIAGAFMAVPLLLALRAVCQRSRRLRLLRVYLEAERPEAQGAATRAVAAAGGNMPTARRGPSRRDRRWARGLLDNPLPSRSRTDAHRLRHRNLSARAQRRCR